MEKQYLNEEYALILDSTTFVDEDIKGLVRIEKVPLTVTLGSDTKLETEWTIEELVRRYDEEEAHTSCPSPQQFLEKYNELFAQGIKDIVVLPMAKEISGTYQSAVLACDSLDAKQKEHVVVVECNVANFGVSNLLVALKPYLEKQLNFKDICAHLFSLTEGTRQVWTVSNLKHLYSGGRLSRLSFFVGTVLRIKPIVGFSNEDGKLHMEKKVRTYNEVDDYLLEQIREEVKSYKKSYLRYVNLNEDASLEKFKAKVKAEFPDLVTTEINEIGPLFTIHIGRDGYGFAFVGDEPVEEVVNETTNRGRLRSLFQRFTNRQ